MDESNPWKDWIRAAAIGTALFFAGGLISFAYSYRPLHGGLVFKVDMLESRLDERNRENLELGDELARLRSQEAEQVDPEKLAAVEKELSKTKRALAQAEKDRDRLKKKHKDAQASSGQWRKRYEKLRDETRVAAKAAERAASVAKKAAPEPAAPPASPNSGPSPTDRNAAPDLRSAAPASGESPESATSAILSGGTPEATPEP